MTTFARFGQDLIAVFAENFKIQPALGHLLLKIVAVFRAEADNADFDLAVGQQLKRLARVAFADGNILALVLREARNELRNKVERGSRTGDADTQPVGYSPPRAEGLDRVHLTQDAPRVLEKDRAALGRADAAARALENAEAEGILHVVQDAAQIRLADEEVFRGL